MTAGTVMYLLSSGLSALSIQLVPGRVTSKMTAVDLAASSNVPADQPIAANGSLITQWDKAYAESTDSNSVLNTILRTKLVPFEDVLPTCENNYTLSNWPLDPPLLSFGFTSRSWQLDALERTIIPDGSLEFPLDADNLPSDDGLPMDIANATYLVVATTQVVPEVLSALWENFYDPFAESSDSSYSLDASASTGSAANFLGISPDAFISSSTAILSRMFQSSPNVSANDVHLSYNHISIAHTVTFNSLTMDISTHPLDAGDAEFISLVEECSSDACLPWSLGDQLMPSVGIQPLVYAGGVCLNSDGTADLLVDLYSEGIESTVCPQRSNTSMLLVGLAKRVVGDTWDASDDVDRGTLVELTGVKVVYTVTVGVLSWSIVDDVAADLSATCVPELGCRGVYAMLDPSQPDSSDVLTVGEAALPLGLLDNFSLARLYSGMYMGWKRLVTLSPHLSFILTIGAVEPLLPRRFTNITDAGESLRNQLRNCGQFIDLYIKTVEKNHLYAEESLQMTYTAGFFFLSQNAEKHRRVSDHTASLELAGNTQEIRVQALIPTLNVVVSSVGCVGLLVMAIGIVVARKRTSESQELADADPEFIAEVLLNSVKYPPTFLRATVGDLVASSSNVCITSATFTERNKQTAADAFEFTLDSFRRGEAA